MSGRTFTIQSSWHDALRALELDVDPVKMRKAVAISDSINQQIEEHMNRYVATYSTDTGDFVFDAEGDFTLKGNLYLDGGDIATSSSGERVVLTEDGAGGALGLSLASLLLYTGAEDEPAQLQVQTVSTTHYFYGYAGADDTGGDANPAYWSLNSSGTGLLGIGTAAGSSLVWGDRYVEVYNTLRLPNGSVSAPSYTFQGDLNTGMYRPTTDAIRIVAGGTVVLQGSDDASVTPAYFNNTEAIVTGVTLSTYTRTNNAIQIRRNNNLVAAFDRVEEVTTGNVHTIWYMGSENNDRWIYDQAGEHLGWYTGTELGLYVQGDNVFGAAGVYNNTDPTAANVYVDGFGILQRSTSRRASKTDIGDWLATEDEYMKLRPRTWKSKKTGSPGAGFVIEEFPNPYLWSGDSPDAMAMNAYTTMRVQDLIRRVRELEDAILGA